MLKWTAEIITELCCHIKVPKRYHITYNLTPVFLLRNLFSIFCPVPLFIGWGVFSSMPGQFWLISVFLPEASFDLRVFSLPASVCQSACQSLVCLHDNPGPFQGFWLRSLVKIIVWGDEWPRPLRSNLTSNSKLTPLWVCPNHYSPPIQVRISKFGPQMHFTTVKILINLGLDWPWTSLSFLIPNLFFYFVVLCIEIVKHSLVCFNTFQWLFHSLYTSAHGECTARMKWGLYCCSAFNLN